MSFSFALRAYASVERMLAECTDFRVTKIKCNSFGICYGSNAGGPLSCRTRIGSCADLKLTGCAGVVVIRASHAVVGMVDERYVQTAVPLPDLPCYRALTRSEPVLSQILASSAQHELYEVFYVLM